MSILVALFAQFALLRCCEKTRWTEVEMRRMIIQVGVETRSAEGGNTSRGRGVEDSVI